MTPTVLVRQGYIGDKAELQSNHHREEPLIEPHRKDIPNILPMSLPVREGH
jgi:hypothetical protein